MFFHWLLQGEMFGFSLQRLKAHISMMLKRHLNMLAYNKNEIIILKKNA